jgi:hypothetical protein
MGKSQKVECRRGGSFLSFGGSQTPSLGQAMRREDVRERNPTFLQELTSYESGQLTNRPLRESRISLASLPVM